MRQDKQLQPNHLNSAMPSSLLDAFADLCLILSREGIIIAANNDTARVLREENSMLVGKDLMSFLDPTSRPEFSASLARCFVANERQLCNLVLQFPDGSHDIEMTLSTYAPSGDSIDRLCLAVVRDISEEKRKDIDLLRFSNVAHYTLNPLEITDVNGKIIYVNPAFEKASGYSRDELIGKNPNIFGSGKYPKGFWENVWTSIKAGNVWTGEVENKKRNGEAFLSYLLISPVVDRSGKVVGYFGVHRDITEQRRLEQQLFQAQKMESIGTLAAGIAHEVGNPLTSISSLVQVVQRTTQDDFTKEKLELIKHQVTRISKIIRDLVDFSRPSTYEAKLTDVNMCVRHALDIVRVGKKSKSIDFVLNLDPGIPSLHLVPDQVEQVFINILINAVDAVFDVQQHHPERTEGRVTISSSVAGEHLEVMITDNGKGMSEEEVKQIFEPFFTTKGVGEGTGLGLWVSYGIVKSFHGHIRVQSRVGDGASFTILLPLHSNY
jgi:PAS domain S-box-containing protein